jgi:hypothetical protein
MKTITIETKTERPQDLVFTPEELAKAFGKKMTRAEYLRSLRSNFNRKYEDEETTND